MALRLVMVGAGDVSRSLLRRLGEAWEVVVVDPSQGRLGALRGERRMETVAGDGSSRVVLARAGLEHADALVVATGDDDVNLEACRLGCDGGVGKIVAVVADPQRVGEFRDLGVTTFNPAQLAAQQVSVALEPRRVTSETFASGRVEVMEFQVTADSPVRGMSVQEVGALGGSVVAITRGETLVLPPGPDEALSTDDLVTVAGRGAAIADIIRQFTTSSPRFPLDFGKHVLVPLNAEVDRNPAFVEALALTRNTGATSLVVAHAPPPEVAGGGSSMERALTVSRFAAGEVPLQYRRVEGRMRRGLVGLAHHESVGVVVLPADLAKGPSVTSAGRAVGLLRRAATPVLVSRRLDPYRRVLVGARRTAAGRAALGAAIDLASAAKAELRALAVADPEFISGPDATGEARRALQWAREQALVHGVDAGSELGAGNPVRSFLEAAASVDLVVLGVSQDAGVRSFRSTLAARVAERAEASVLLVPAPERRS